MHWILGICAALCIYPSLIGLSLVYAGGGAIQATAGAVFFVGFIVAIGLSRIVYIMQKQNKES